MANLILKASSGNSLVVQGGDASPAITVGNTGQATFAEPATMSGTLGVTGATTLSGATTCSTTLGVTGNTTLSGSANNLGTVTAGAVNNTVTGDGLGMKKIGSGTFSGSSAVETGADWGSYRVHKMYFTAQSSTTGGYGNMYLVVKIGGSYVTAAEYAYVVHGMRSNSGTAILYNSDGAGTDVQAYMKLTADSSRADSKSSWEITFHNATKTDDTGMIAVGLGYNHDGASRLLGAVSYCQINNTGVVQDVKIYPTNYTLTGSWDLFGII